MPINDSSFIIKHGDDAWNGRLIPMSPLPVHFTLVFQISLTGFSSTVESAQMVFSHLKDSTYMDVADINLDKTDTLRKLSTRYYRIKNRPLSKLV